MKALRRLALLLAALLALPWAALAEDEYWDAYDRPVVCCEDRTGCEVLQMVMMGSFAALQPTDSLTVRVMSAALPALCDVTDADFSHFCEEFSVDEGTVRRPLLRGHGQLPVGGHAHLPGRRRRGGRGAAGAVALPRPGQRGKTPRSRWRSSARAWTKR